MLMNFRNHFVFSRSFELRMVSINSLIARNTHIITEESEIVITKIHHAIHRITQTFNKQLSDMRLSHIGRQKKGCRKKFMRISNQFSFFSGLIAVTLD